MRTAAPRRFGRDGYDILDGLLSAAQVESLRIRVETFVASAPGSSCARPHNTLFPLRWDDPIVADVLADDTRVRRLGDAVDAGDLRWISGYVSIKDADSEPLDWHRDWWCWDHPVSYRREAVQVALLCYLTDTDARLGALRVVPGSHASSRDLDREEVTLELRAGDAAVLDYRLLHGTHGNAGDHRRDCILLSFTPCWSELPAEIRGHLISHSALPAVDERVPPTGWAARLLPRFTGPRRDLPLRRDAPTDFAIEGAPGRPSQPRLGAGGDLIACHRPDWS